MTAGDTLRRTRDDWAMEETMTSAVPFEAQVGDLVVYTCVSAISGQLVNKWIATVGKRTKAGYIHLKGVAMDKFQRHSHGKAYSQWEPRGFGGFYKVVLTKPTEHELKVLPRSRVDGREYADRIKREKKAQAERVVA